MEDNNNINNNQPSSITLTISSTLFCNGKPKEIHCTDWQELSVKLLNFLKEANFNYSIKINTDNDQTR